MTPRQPPESPDDDMQSALLQAVHTALNDSAILNDPAHERPATEAPQDVARVQIADECDPVEAYLRGPTVFTA
jgi:hypothetical protein